MSVCPMPGHPETYGLGIRISFYIHWLGEILITHISEPNRPMIQASTLVLSAAISVALVIQCAKRALEPAEIYIVLLLASGMYFPLIPIYILKLISCCHPDWNARSWVNKKATAQWIKLALFVEAVLVAGIGLWFWTTFIPGWNRPSCSEYGFLFRSVSIDSEAFVVLNALIYVGFILACFGHGLDAIGCLGRRWRKARKRYRKRDTSETKLWWKRSYILSSTVIVAIAIAAVELSVRYNKIPQVNSISTTAQLYPIFTSVVVLILLLILHHKQTNQGSEQGNSPSTSPGISTVGVFQPRSPPRSSHGGSVRPGGGTTASATTSSSTNGGAAPNPGPNMQTFPPGWNRHQDPTGRVFWLPEGQIPGRPLPPGPEYPGRARTVR